MRGILVISMAIMLAFTVVACSGGRSEREVYEDLIQQVEEAVSDAINISPAVTTPQQSDSQTQGTQEAIPTPQLSNLNLPIVKADTVFHYVPQSERTPYFVTASGDLVVDNYGSQKVVDTNVRSVKVSYYGDAAFYLKTDGSLWGVGRNDTGRLGDGTGINRDEPVHIMDNVASFGVDGLEFLRIYAIKNDKTYWVWGPAGRFGMPHDIFYEPVLVAENVVKHITGSPTAHTQDNVVLTSSGYLLSAKTLAAADGNESQLSSLLPDQPVSDIISYGHVVYWIDSGNVLWSWAAREEAVQIAENVDTIHRYSGGHSSGIFFICKEGVLYGIGNNSGGQLGDGTRIDRDTPVKIAEDVIDVTMFAFIKSNGELWFWPSNNPTPVMMFDNAIAILKDSGIFDPIVILQDGSVHRLSVQNSTVTELADNIRIPE